MFSWATSHLEKLAQTVAPPAPTDSFAALRSCCQQGNDDGAVSWLYEQQLKQQQQGVEVIDPLYFVVQQIKGQTILHWACLFSLPKLLHFCLQSSDPLTSTGTSNSNSNNISPHQPHAVNLSTLVDLEGNTALHCAAMSDRPNGLETIKLILQFAATNSASSSSILSQLNRQKQTAYDVAVRDTVRQYLLPLQLQAETQTAIDNGGVGLPPGIDLGGLTIQNPHLPPPPIMMGGTGGGLGFQAQPPSLHSTPPLQQQHQQQPIYSNPSGTSTLPAPPAATAAASGLPLAPNSAGSATATTGAYARTGRSSAAFVTRSGGIQPDGFHSSSSDKNLQEKYGHVSTGTAAAGKHLPPPPTSGNTVGLDLAASMLPPGHSLSAPPSLNNGANPFAGGMAAVNRAATTRRYVAYEPFGATTTGNQLERPMSAMGFGNTSNTAMSGAVMAPMYTNNAATPATAAPQMSSPSLASPPALTFGTTPANTPVMQPWQVQAGVPSNGTSCDLMGGSSVSHQPNPVIDSSVTSNLFGVPTSTPTKPYPFGAIESNTRTPTMTLATPPPPYSSSGGFHRSNSSGASPEVAAALFAQPSSFPGMTAATTFTTATVEATVASRTQAQSVSGTPSNSTNVRTASELFGGAIPMSENPTEATSTVATQPPFEETAPFAGNDADLTMDEIPLTPGDTHQKPVVESSGTETSVASTSLYGTIGMPPPPLSRK